MISYINMRYVQVVETMKLGSVCKLMRQVIYFNRVAVPVEIELCNLRPMENFVQRFDEKLLEITPEMISRRTLSYPIESRYLKAGCYLDTGYRGFAMVNANEVSGDIWCAVATNPKDGLVHPDEKWLHIRCGNHEAYAFDMYVNPDKRGANLAASLQNGALLELKKSGFTKAYGFFWADNIAALWVHRTLRWKELTRVKASRFILSRKFRVCQVRKESLPEARA